jgi:ubiquinone/menaquinone biosynthesis C-methylase UbiE
MTPYQEKIFFEIHKDNPREGPGNFESTWKAYTLMKKLPTVPKLLDIGCGPGMQTIHLAQISNAIIYAIDTYDYFIHTLNQKIIEKKLTDRIFAIKGDMGALNFEKDFFDIIWGEGSIYIIGVEKGLELWKPYLKSGGYIAVTEVSWLKSGRPRVLKQFWDAIYPKMNFIDDNLSIINKAGYKMIGQFVIPECAWKDEYYYYIEKKLLQLTEKYKNDPDAMEILNSEEKEIDMYRKYSDYYGYVFYIMEKV